MVLTIHLNVFIIVSMMDLTGEYEMFVIINSSNYFYSGMNVIYPWTMIESNALRFETESDAHVFMKSQRIKGVIVRISE